MAPGYDSVLKTIKNSHSAIATPEFCDEVRSRRDGLVAMNQQYQLIRGIGPKVSEVKPS